MDRRNFIKSGGAIASTLLLPFPFETNEDPIPIGIVGTGWWGKNYLLKYLIPTGNYEVIALCDVNSHQLEGAVKMITEAGGKKPKLFSDYKEMYEMPDLEAVIIATPTHWHALQFIDACDKGLHVFLEKPISYDIREGQAMLAAHKKAQNVVLVDFPRTMANVNAEVKAFIDSGEAGKIIQAKANIHNKVGSRKVFPVPDTIDFDTFCGPAPMQDYLCRANDKNRPDWRWQHAFSRGVMADWGIHYIHNARQVLGLGVPTSISAMGGIAGKIPVEHPDYLDVKYDFDGFQMYWSNKSWGYTIPNPEHRIGLFYYGDKATIFAGDFGWEVFPNGGKEKISHGDVSFNPGNPNFEKAVGGIFMKMFNEFAEGIRNKSNAGITNKFEEGFKTTSTIIYGDMAYRANANLEVDPATMDIKNHKKAHKMLKRAYRKPYKHPYKG